MNQEQNFKPQIVAKDESILEKINDQSTDRLEEAKKTENFVKELPEDSFNDFRAASSPFFNLVVNENPEVQEIFSKKLAGEIIIDIGCGSKSDFVLESLDKYNIKEYVGVDKELPEEIEQELKSYRKEHKYNINYKESDMLIFLSKLPDKSVNIIMNGIDDDILTNDEYWKKLVEEITRVVKDGGIFTGSKAGKMWLGELPDFKNIYSNQKHTQFFLYEKQVK